MSTRSFTKSANRPSRYRGGLTGSRIIKEYKRKPKGFYRSSGIKGGSEAVHGIPSITHIQYQRNKMDDKQFEAYLKQVIEKIAAYKLTHPDYTHPLEQL